MPREHLPENALLLLVQRPVVIEELNPDIALLQRPGDIWLRVLTDESREGNLAALKVLAGLLENRGGVEGSL